MARSSSITLPSKAQSPFKQLALSYYDMGLSIFPCLGEDGKHPLVKWKPYQDRQPTRSELDKMIARFSNANIGLITGRLSNITVVDVDDPALPLEALYDEFGETPVVVSTPRGGKHLYYRFVDEKNSTSAKRKIDVRSEGGYVIAPPSINPEMNRQYVFLEGDISFLEDLPCIKKHEAGPRRQQARLGERNTSLFNHLVKVAANNPAPSNAASGRSVKGRRVSHSSNSYSDCCSIHCFFCASAIHVWTPERTRPASKIYPFKTRIVRMPRFDWTGRLE